MKKLFILFSALFTLLQSHAQGNYYTDTDTSKRCHELKEALHTLINSNVSVRAYEDAYNFMSDNDIIQINGQNYIWDIYSHAPQGTQHYTYKPGDKCGSSSSVSEGSCWNREHILPSSWFNTANPTYSDIVNLLPTDAYVNNRKGNLIIAKVNTPQYTSQNGSKVGTSDIPEISGSVFEPIDEYKGDVARILLYMNVRYSDKFSNWNHTEFNKIKNTASYTKEYTDMLLQWHKSDPPSQKEKDRNDRIYAYQGNRNPFVDYPQFASYIWEAEDCASVGVRNYQSLEAQIYPNPVQSELYLQSSEPSGSDYYITDIRGKVVKKGMIFQNRISVAKLMRGTYFLFIEKEAKTSYGKFIIAH